MNVKGVQELFQDVSDKFGCTLHARESAKKLERILVKAEEAVKELTGGGPSPAHNGGGPSPAHNDIQTAGDYVVDINGVELVAQDSRNLRQTSWGEFQEVQGRARGKAWRTREK